MIIMVILVFFLVISVNRRLFRYFGSYSGISVIPVILVNIRTVYGIGTGWKICIFSSPEHEVLMVSYCDQSMSVVRRPLSTICFKS